MTEPEAHGDATVSVGEILEQLRRNKNLGVQEVATRLHLDPRVIEALEGDAWEQLPASIYVRGYIRNYGKLLGADIDQLIQLYDQTGVDDQPEIIPEVRHASQTSSSDKPVKAFTYLISLVLVILLIAWWQSNFLVRDDGGKQTGEQQAKGNGHSTVPPAFNYHFDVVTHPTDPFYRAPQQEEPESAGTEQAGPNQPETAEPGATARQADTGPITSDSTGPDTISFKLSADSWIEVYGADNQKVYVSLARAGDTVVLHGKAPFSVLLGFAQGVSVEFNGEPFDPASYSRSGVARFTLGGSGEE